MHSNTQRSGDVSVFLSVEDININMMLVWKKMASVDALGWFAGGWAVTSTGRNMLAV